MKKIIIFFAIYAYCINTNAQLNLNWAYSLGSTLDEHAMILSSAVSMNNSIVVCGMGDSTIDFDTGPGILNLNNINNTLIGNYLAKYDSAGSLLFTRSTLDTVAEGYSNGNFIKIVSDNGGNFYLILGIGGPWGPTPYFGVGWNVGGNMFFDSIPHGVMRHYLLKFDGLGNCLYVKKLGNNIYVNDAMVDNNDNLIICGNFSGTKDLAPGPPVQLFSSIQEDAFITKVDSAGNIVFIKIIHCLDPGPGGYALIFPYALATDSQNNIFFALYLLGVYDLDPGTDTNSVTAPYSNGNYNNVVFEKLDSSGNFEFRKKFFYNAAVQWIKTDAYDNVYVFGDTSISKYGNNGNLIFTKLIGNKVDILDLHITRNNKFFLYGASADSAGFDSIGIPNIGPAIGTGKKIIAQTDSLFNAYYYQTISNSNDSTVNWGWGITSDLQDNLYMCGAYRGSFDADFNSGTYYLNNPFASIYINSGLISKYATSNNPLNILYRDNSNSVLVYPNPFNTSLQVYFGKEHDQRISINVKNVFGQKIIDEQEIILHNYRTETIRLSSLPNGIYFLEIIIGGEHIVKKIVKE